jgi:hypothetical protein
LHSTLFILLYMVVGSSKCSDVTFAVLMLVQLLLLLLFPPMRRFRNESHVELPCNEVRGPQAAQLAHTLSSAARSWWQSLVEDASSFTKPTYYLGMGSWRVTNMLADGAHERTPGNITLLANGATGFRAVGDRMCFKAKVGVHADMAGACQ